MFRYIRRQDIRNCSDPRFHRAFVSSCHRGCHCIISCMRIRSLAALLAAVWLTTGMVSAQDQGNRYRTGHSMHGHAFDEGPREKPVEDGWHRQGALPHHHEQPRGAGVVRPGPHAAALVLVLRGRAGLPVVPEARPDNAMAYWGLARASGNRERRAGVHQGGAGAQGDGDSTGAGLHRGVGAAWTVHARAATATSSRKRAREDRPRLSGRHRGQGALAER